MKNKMTCDFILISNLIFKHAIIIKKINKLLCGNIEWTVHHDVSMRISKCIMLIKNIKLKRKTCNVITFTYHCRHCTTEKLRDKYNC